MWRNWNHDWRQAFKRSPSLILVSATPTKPFEPSTSDYNYSVNDEETKAPNSTSRYQYCSIHDKSTWPTEEEQHQRVGVSVPAATVEVTVDEDADVEVPAAEDKRAKKRNGNPSPNWAVWSKPAR